MVLFVLIVFSFFILSFSRDGVYNHQLDGEHLQEKVWEKNGITIKFSKEPNGYKVAITFPEDKICNNNIRSDLFNASDLRLMDEYRLGPDEIIVQFEGASIQAEIAQTDDNCLKYYAMFQVPITGKYQLKVIRLRTDYAALREDDNNNPDLNYELILDAVIDENLGYYAPVPCTSLVQGYWVTHMNGYYRSEPTSIKDHCALQDENAISTRRGLPLSNHLLLHNTFPTDGCVKDVQNYGWNRRICKSDYNHAIDGAGEFVARGHPNITTHRPYDYFKRRKMLFIGDRHMRDLASLFTGHICKYDDRRLRWNETYVKVVNHENEVEIVPYMKVYFRESEYDDYREPIDKCRNNNPTDIDKCPAYTNALNPYEKQRISECFHDMHSNSCDLYDLDCDGSSIAYIKTNTCHADLGKFMEGYNYVLFNCGQHTCMCNIFRIITTTLRNFLSTTSQRNRSCILFILLGN